jgi:hypothetical protein
LIQEVEFLKKGFLSSKELDAIVSSLSIAGGIDRGIEERTGARQAEKEAEGVPESSGDGSIGGGTFDGSEVVGDTQHLQALANFQRRDCLRDCPGQ